jgi:hypothetical protein
LQTGSGSAKRAFDDAALPGAYTGGEPGFEFVENRNLIEYCCLRSPGCPLLFALHSLLTLTLQAVCINMRRPDRPKPPVWADFVEKLARFGAGVRVMSLI